MGDDTLDAYLTHWRGATPQRATAWLFLRHDERVRYGALAALENEWLKTLREVHEPQVAAVKLGWWREELQLATGNQPRHPLTKVLFADASIRAIPLAYWTAPVEAATATLGAPPAADFVAQRDMAAPLARALAALETCVWFGRDVDGERAAAAVLLGGLVSSVRALDLEVAHGRSPLPMNLLARHGITVEGLARDGAPRRAALRDGIEELQRQLSCIATMPGPLTLFRAVDVQQDLDALARATVADDPLAALCGPGHGFGGVLKTWRAARIWRATARSGSAR